MSPFSFIQINQIQHSWKSNNHHSPKERPKNPKHFRGRRINPRNNRRGISKEQSQKSIFTSGNSDLQKPIHLILQWDDIQHKTDHIGETHSHITELHRQIPRPWKNSSHNDQIKEMSIISDHCISNDTHGSEDEEQSEGGENINLADVTGMVVFFQFTHHCKDIGDAVE